MIQIKGQNALIFPEDKKKEPPTSGQHKFINQETKSQMNQ